MQSQRNFQQQFKDFKINLELNDANVLEISTMILKTNDTYTYAIDKTYLSQHSQFFNITEQPSQLFQLIRSKILQVKFQGGKLIVPYGNEKKNGQISILLFRTSSFQRKAVQDQGKQIAQIFGILEKFTSKIDSIGALDAKINELKENDKKLEQKLTASLAEQEEKINSGLKDVQDQYLDLTNVIDNLKNTDKQIQEQIKSLTSSVENSKIIFAEFQEKYRLQIKQILDKLQSNPNRQIKQSCEWIGFLEQNAQRHNIFFEEFTIIRAPNGLVAGKGQDGAGKFQVLGRVGKDSKEVKFQKRYTNHTVFYLGVIIDNSNQISIEGTWSQNNNNQVNTTTNKFKIYKKT